MSSNDEKCESYITTISCICIRTCDCQDPDNEPALCSNECPEHNLYQLPNPECKSIKHWFEK